MDRDIQEQIQQYAFTLFPILARKPLKPLAIGAGNSLHKTLCQSFEQADVSLYLDRFFASREYKLALINCYQACYTRYNLDGSPSSTTVNEHELLGLARHGIFKNKKGLTEKAAQLVSEQKRYVSERKKQLKDKVMRLKQSGFSNQFLLHRLGKRIEPYLKVNAIGVQFYSENMINEARMMRERTTSMTVKEVKVFQKALYNQGVPVYLILMATNHYEPMLYELVRDGEQERKYPQVA
ncbi:hypothetical protein [Vibrio crassostreae]|uniref:hypothetical protein n=1 Tax=Vibrio crassostreae TaxID=246167 RepID=UPI0010508E9E|nr:hypothetical protein [Vibrio crassostreae]TCT98860.1 hypothetical protein EDB47_12833 [Vibrio crassostreae]